MLEIDKKSFRKKYIKDKTKKPPMGLRIYTAPQGGGKTLSMVHDAIELVKQFPKMKIVTNLNIKLDKVKEISRENEIIIFGGTQGLKEALKKAENGVDGVLMIIDEFQLFASKKDGVPVEIFQQLCQQRKHRRFMMGTAQDWEDIDVSTRKKVKEVVKCSMVLGKIQVNTYFDGYSIKYDKKQGGWECKQLGTKIFKHNQELYECYDTYAEIATNKDFVTTQKPPEIAVSVSVPPKQRR